MQTPKQYGERQSATSLLFTPRSADGRSGSEYRTPHGGNTGTRSPSPTPEPGKLYREGSFFREHSTAGSLAGGSNTSSKQREGSAAPAPATGRVITRVNGDRSRLSQQSHPQDGSGRAHSVHGTSPSSGGIVTARSRRQSTTPARQAPQDAPLPPPTSSMFDTAAVGSAWANATPVDRPGTPLEQQGTVDAPPVEPPTTENTECWVIVYGFRAGDLELLLHELRKAGEIVQYGTFGAPATCNWLYLQFRDKWAAQRALYRDGEQINRTTMIGVRPLDAAHRSAIREHLHADGPPRENLDPTPAMQRRYLIDAAPPQIPSGSVPATTQSGWGKLKDIVLGMS